MDINKFFQLDINKFFQSTVFKTIIAVLIAVIIFLLIFKLGEFVGFKKARFSYGWGENYHRNFAGPKEGFFRDFIGKDFINPHGIFGQILKIDSSTIIVKGGDNVEKTVLVKEDTFIEAFRNTLKINDLKVDDNIVVIGQPNDQGQIEAKFIRIMPQSPPGPKEMPFMPFLKDRRQS